MILDPDTNQVTLTRTGASVQLTPIETRLLRALMRQPGRTFTREALAIKAWGYEYEDKSNQPNLIQMVHDVGYRLQPGRLSAACR